MKSVDEDGYDWRACFNISKHRSESGTTWPRFVRGLYQMAVDEEKRKIALRFCNYSDLWTPLDTLGSSGGGDGGIRQAPIYGRFRPAANPSSPIFSPLVGLAEA